MADAHGDRPAASPLAIGRPLGARPVASIPPARRADVEGKMRTPWSRIVPLASSCGVLLALLLAGPGLAQVPPNDACVSAIPMVDGPNGPFTNANATTVAK